MLQREKEFNDSIKHIGEKSRMKIRYKMKKSRLRIIIARNNNCISRGL